ncbi:MAG: CDP-alcohol phosphatidyltransferase family protein [Geminicoccaceae bacterium]|nr:CDP-alcohol phosphatidyltransferase family protein [Geminicoccaceae bacterium]
MLAHLANVLTTCRLLAAVPVAFLVVEEVDHLAFWLFLAAALTDLADGYVAKRWAGPSSVGAALDPVADKLFAGALFLAVASRELVPLWLVVLVIGRDVVLVAGALLLRNRLSDFRVEPLVIGKISTFLQLTFLGFLLGEAAEIAVVGAVVALLLPLTAAVTLISAIAYLVVGLRLVGGAVRAA